MASVTPDSKFLMFVQRVLKRFSREWIQRKPVKQSRLILSITACSRKWSKPASFENYIVESWNKSRSASRATPKKLGGKPQSLSVCFFPGFCVAFFTPFIVGLSNLFCFLDL